MASSTPLSGLAEANSIATLALEVAGVSIPLIKGAITAIKQSISGGTVTYEVVLQTDQASLDNTVNVSIADLVAINAELTRLGKPTLDVPAAPAAPPATS